MGRDKSLGQEARVLAAKSKASTRSAVESWKNSAIHPKSAKEIGHACVDCRSLKSPVVDLPRSAGDDFTTSFHV